jgi:hypothetical protein
MKQIRFFKLLVLYTATIIGIYFLYFYKQENTKPQSKTPFIYQQF